MYDTPVCGNLNGSLHAYPLVVSNSSYIGHETSKGNEYRGKYNEEPMGRKQQVYNDEPVRREQEVYNDELVIRKQQVYPTTVVKNIQYKDLHLAIPAKLRFL